MLQPRYVIAFIVACLILAAGAVFCAYTRQSFVEHIRQEIAKPKNADETSPEVAAMLDQGVIPPGFGSELPSSMSWKIDLADLLAGLWYVWVIVAFGACFAVAYFITGQKVPNVGP